MAKTKYTKDRLRKIENALVRTGSDKVAMRESAISKQTFYRWMRDKSDFCDIITRAKERFINLRIRTDPELEKKAIQTLKEMLQPREITKTKETTRVLINQDTGETLRVLDVTTETTTYIRDPSIKIIEKIIGKGTIEDVLWRISLRKAMEDPKGELYEQLFGDKGKLARDKKWGEDVFADIDHLEELERLREQTEIRYEDGMIDFQTYHDAILNQAKTFSYVKTQVENRAEKSIGATSYSEILAQVKQFVQLVMDVIREVVNDVSVERKRIPGEISRRIRKRTGADRQARKFQMRDQSNR